MQEAVIPTREEVREALDMKLAQMVATNEIPDVITFAGNGEPTLHADFEEIINDTLELRDRHCPTAKVSVLSNSTRIHKPSVCKALKKVDNNILKFDTAIDRTLQLIDRPTGKGVCVSWLIENLQKFDGNLIIQTMFLRGEYEGEKIDNTTDEELTAWINALKLIRPKQVMIYSIDRETPAQGLEKVSVDELNIIAEKLRAHGFEVSVAG
jgi:wyosine [tRNA(Phe)-imidazoG37] synthetase (radical SAM superfamily)